MADWDGSNKAPKGMHRVIGCDDFPFPPEDYWIGDYADLDEARDLAKTRTESMNSVHLYEKRGKRCYCETPPSAHF
jgi:hypothetical protein